MTIDHVEPCVCCDHEPNTGDSVYYGMPVLKVAGQGNRPLYTAVCPVCGIGGQRQQKTAYRALKVWNEEQQYMKYIKEHGIFADDEEEEQEETR